MVALNHLCPGLAVPAREPEHAGVTADGHLPDRTLRSAGLAPRMARLLPL